MLPENESVLRLLGKELNGQGKICREGCVGGKQCIDMLQKATFLLRTARHITVVVIVSIITALIVGDEPPPIVIYERIIYLWLAGWLAG